MVAQLGTDAVLNHPDNGDTRSLLGRPDGWARVEVASEEARLPEVSSPTLAILLAELPVEPWRVEALLRRLHDRGYRGLAAPWPTTPGLHTLDVAARLGFGLLDTANPTTLARACWELMEAQDALTLTYVQRVARSIEYSARDLRDLLRHLASSTRCGVAIVDADGLQQHAGPEPTAALVAAIDFGSRWVGTAAVGDEAGVSVTLPDSPGDRLVFHGRGWSAAQLHAVERAAEVAMPAVAARMMVDELRALDDAARSTALLTGLIESDGVPEPALEERWAERGWRLDGWHLGAVVQPRGSLAMVRLAHVAADMLAAAPIRGRVAIVGDVLMCWVTTGTRPTAATTDATVRELQRFHERLLADWPIATGVGTLAPRAAGLVDSLARARKAAALAARRADARWFIQTDRFGLTDLIHSWASDDALVLAAEPLRAVLGDADIETLAAYLDNESSVSATAAALQVHRNTIGPRIRRIEQKLAADLTDPDVRLALQIACRVARG